jgi:hypothetical protein
MLATQRAHALAVRASSARPLAPARRWCPHALAPAGRRPLASPPRANAADAAAADALDDEGDVDWTEDMPAPVRRRVRALRDVQERLDDLARRLARERASLEARYEGEAAPLLDERAQVVSGARPVDAYPLPAGDAQEGEEDGGEESV